MSDPLDNEFGADREVDPGIDVRFLGKDCCDHPQQFSVCINERATGGAWIYSGVGLYEILKSIKSDSTAIGARIQFRSSY